jgi:hypothetical protein
MERSTALLGILARVAGGEGGGVAAERLLPHATSVAAEQEQLRQLKSVLGTQVQCGGVQCRAEQCSVLPQGTLRPIFESQLKQRRLVRERAMALRRTLAEAGLDYSSIAASLKAGRLASRLEATGAAGEDVAEIVELVQEHFRLQGEQEAVNGGC